MDVSISIELHGFAPRQPVTLTATQEFSSGARYPAQASFMTDNAGSVYVTRQVPLSGTYDAASAMGLFWSAERLPGEARVPPEGSVMQPWSVLLQAEGADGRR